MPHFRRFGSTLHRARTSGRLSAEAATPLVGTYITFPSARLGIHLYVAIGQDPNADPDTWIWTEIPPNYILWRDKIRIQRGRAPGQTQANPSTMALSLKLAQGRFTWGLGTPMRLDVDPGTGAARRFTGTVVARNPRADTSGRDRWLQIQVAGPLQRLGRQLQPAHSAAWTSIAQAFKTDGTGHAGDGRPYLAFWYPLEDGAAAVSAASAIVGKPAMTATHVAFAGASAPTGVAAAPALGATNGRLQADVPAYTDPSGYNHTIHFYMQATGACSVFAWTLGNGATYHNWAFNVDASGNCSLSIDGTAGLAACTGTLLTDGNWHTVQIDFSATAVGPGNIFISVQSDSGTYGTVTLAGTSIGSITGITINPTASPNLTSMSTLAGGPVYLISDANTMNGDLYDPAVYRFATVCQVEGTAFEVSGDGHGFTGVLDVNGKKEWQEAMGVRGNQTQLSIMRECEAAEDGFLFESLGGRVKLLWHDERENQPVNMSFRVGDGGNAQVLPPFEPQADDSRIINRMTVSAADGSSFTDQETELSRSIARIGLYDASLTLNVSAIQPNSSSGGANHHASFEVMRGTIDEPRFDSLSANLAKSPELITAWLARDPIGSHIEIDNLDETIWLTEAHQLIEGYTEDITQVSWEITMALTPEAPYRTFTVEGDENLGRLDNPDCTLVGDLSDDWTITSIQVACPSGLWRTGPAGWPLCLAGEPAERVEVVSIAGSSSPQTFTITRHQGKTVPHLNGSSSTLWRPGVIALHTRR